MKRVVESIVYRHRLFARTHRKYIILLIMATAFIAASPAFAEVKVADFLEWATPSQIAKVEKTYDQVIGEKVNWNFFSSGVEMTKGIIAGDVDIAFSQGMAPFVSAVNQNAPIKMVGIAVVYEAADDCIVRNALDINKDNAKALEGKKIAVPFNTMAEFGLRMTMRYLNVDIRKIQLVNANPADAAFMLLETEVDAACAFGENSLSKMKRVGKPLLSGDEKRAAGIISFDVISVTDKFAREKPEALRRFLQVTADANAAFAKDQSKVGVIAKDAGMSVDKTITQINSFTFPTVKQQLNAYFSDGGIATRLLPFMGKMFASEEYPEKSDYSRFIDTSFLK